MFVKVWTSVTVFMAFGLHQVNAHAAVSPALGVSGTPVRNDVQRPSTAKPCGSVNIAKTIDTSTSVNAAADGSFQATAINFNGGADGSRKVTAKVDTTGTGKSFAPITVTTNGDATPSGTGPQNIVASLPAGTKCTGGAAKDKCLVQFVTTAGFGNCVVVQTSGGRSTAAKANAASGSAAAATSASSTSTSTSATFTATSSNKNDAGNSKAGAAAVAAADSSSTGTETSAAASSTCTSDSKKHHHHHHNNAANSTTTDTNTTTTGQTSGEQSNKEANSTTTDTNTTTTAGQTSGGQNNKEDMKVGGTRKARALLADLDARVGIDGDILPLKRRNFAAWAFRR